MFSRAQMAICNKARQIGLSHTSAAVGVFWAAALGELTTIISIGDRESIEVLDKARKHAEMLRRLGSHMAELGPRDKANEVTFASGGRILALPSSAGRSFSGNVFLDEFAYQEDAARVWDNAAAVTTHRGFKLRVASTPNGPGNAFHAEWRRASAGLGGWERHEIPIETAVAEGFPLDVEKCWAIAKGDPRLFDQLFRCSFLDNSLQYIPSALLDASVSDEPPPHHGGVTYAGLDIGRTANLTALVIVHVVDGVAWVVALETKQRTSLSDIDELVDIAVRTYGVTRLCVDATGMGAFPAESLQRTYGRQRIEPVTFTAQVKESLATTMYQSFSDRRVRTRRSDHALREDVASIRRIVTTAGNVRYDAPNTDEGHADRAWALALALHAAARPSAQRVEVLDYHEHE